jgi:glycine dehydrogenase
MVTYPSTHGVFEEGIVEICEIVHEHGGQVYMDGANMNAQVGLCRPATSAPTSATSTCTRRSASRTAAAVPAWARSAWPAHLAPYLPGHPLATSPAGRPGVGGAVRLREHPADLVRVHRDDGRRRPAPRDRGRDPQRQLHRAPARRALPGALPRRQRARRARVHPRLRVFKKTAGIEADDVAKRLMDYGFHAPTMSFPVPGTLMIEPTESESLAELDRFCDAMIAIRGEIAAIEPAKPIAPTTRSRTRRTPPRRSRPTEWNHRLLAREQAAFPAPWLAVHKYWPPVSRVDNAYGDRHLVVLVPRRSGPAPVQLATSSGIGSAPSRRRSIVISLR